MIDNKFLALLDEKQKLNHLLELKEEEFTQFKSQKEEKIREMKQATELYKEKCKQEMQNWSNHVLDLMRTLELKEEELTQLDSQKNRRISGIEQATELYKEQSKKNGTLSSHILDLKQTIAHQQDIYECMAKLQKELKSELECSICMDTFENPYMIPECCHRFCKHCIEESLARSGRLCPLCRCNVTSKRGLRKDELIGKDQSEDEM